MFTWRNSSSFQKITLNITECELNINNIDNELSINIIPKQSAGPTLPPTPVQTTEPSPSTSSAPDPPYNTSLNTTPSPPFPDNNDPREFLEDDKDTDRQVDVSDIIKSEKFKEKLKDIDLKIPDKYMREISSHPLATRENILKILAIFPNLLDDDIQTTDLGPVAVTPSQETQEDTQNETEPNRDQEALSLSEQDEQKYPVKIERPDPEFNQKASAIPTVTSPEYSDISSSDEDCKVTHFSPPPSPTFPTPPTPPPTKAMKKMFPLGGARVLIEKIETVVDHQFPLNSLPLHNLPLHNLLHLASLPLLIERIENPKRENTTSLKSKILCFTTSFGL